MSTEKSYYGQNTAFRETGGSGLQSFALEIVSGKHCQLDCAGCYKGQGRLGSPKDNMPLDEAREYIDQALEAGFKEIVVMGGEPTIHPDVFEIIKHIRAAGAVPILCTNGIRFRKKEEAGKLKGTATTVVTHGYFPDGEDIIDKFSGRRGYAKMLKEAVKNLKEIKDVTLVLEMPLSDNFFPHAFEFFKFCRESKVIPFIEISRSRDDGTATTSITPEEVAALFEEFKKYDEEHFPHLADKTIAPPAYGNKCTMAITGLHVKNAGGGDYGKVYSCCAQGVSHGDLKEQPLTEIMRTPTLQVFMDQDRFIFGPCADCEIYNVCRGGCRGEAYLKFNCPRASSPVCHRIPAHIRSDKSIMAPASCEGCPAENSPACSL